MHVAYFLRVNDEHDPPRWRTGEPYLFVKIHNRGKHARTVETVTVGDLPIVLPFPPPVLVPPGGWHEMWIAVRDVVDHHPALLVADDVKVNGRYADPNWQVASVGPVEHAGTPL